MSIFETLVIDANGVSPLTIHGGDGPGYVFDREFDPGLAQRRPSWVSGDEGAVLVEDPPYDDATLAMRVRVWPATDTMDAALTALQTLTQKLQECSASGPDGMAVTYTPANATNSYTMYWKLAEYDGAPPITADGELAGWFQNKPVVTVKAQRKPFLYGPENGTVTEAFGSNTIANFTADAGATTNVSITGGVMQASANLTTENRLIRTAGTTYLDLYDSQATVKVTLGGTLALFKAGVILKRVSANTMLAVYVDDNATVSRLRIDKIVAGVATNLASVNLAVRMNASSSYWVRARINGNVVVAEHFTAAPSAGSTVANTTTATLTSTDITTFGVGVSGKSGLIFLPQQAAASLDDWAVAPNVVKGSTPLLTMLLPGIPGDVAAEARFIIEDWAAQARRYIEWGQQWRYTDTATSLQIDSASLVTSGFSGTSTAGSVGSFNTNVIRATLTTSPSAVTGVGPYTHVGSFRVRARVYASSATVYVRLAWSDGSGIFRSNDYALCAWAGWCDVDIGTISISPATLGTQQWSGRIEAYSTTTGDTIDVDFVQLFPSAEGYGKARSAFNYTTGTVIGYDQFTGTTAGGVLNARAAPAGGSWATAGATTDFVFADAPAGGETIARSTAVAEAGGRFAVLGASNITDTEVQASVQATAGATGLRQGVVARYTDTSNYMYAAIEIGTLGSFYIAKRVAGALTVLYASPGLFTLLNTWYTLRLVVYSGGNKWVASILDAGGARIYPDVTGVVTDAILASGKPGVFDLNPSTTPVTRYFDNFSVATPAPEPLVLSSGKQAEVRSGCAIRQDSSGVWGPMPSYYGSRFFLAPAGAENRSTRIATRAVRNDIDGGAAYDNPSGDNLQVQVAYTPRFLLPK